MFLLLVEMDVMHGRLTTWSHKLFQTAHALAGYPSTALANCDSVVWREKRYINKRVHFNRTTLIGVIVCLGLIHDVGDQIGRADGVGGQTGAARDLGENRKWRLNFRENDFRRGDRVPNNNRRTSYTEAGLHQITLPFISKNWAQCLKFFTDAIY